MKERIVLAAWFVLLFVDGIPAADLAPHRMTVDDALAIRDVRSPRISPDGSWVAYSVRSNDLVADKRNTDLWMTSWDGRKTVQLTFRSATETAPQWSPDGRYLAFLSARDDEKDTDQVWLMDRTGGEARKLTAFEGGVDEFAFSPDGKRLAVIAGDPDPSANDDRKLPIVIDRYYFKEDKSGYLGSVRHHLYSFDLETLEPTLLTPGNSDQTFPVWSPDGEKIAFVSKGGEDPDRTNNWDLYVIEAREGSTPRQLTTFEGPDNEPDTESPPAWSPDGRFIAYIRGGPPKLIYYAVNHLAVIPAAGGTPQIITSKIDRNVSRPRWSDDGSALFFLVEDDQSRFLARIPRGGGAMQPVTRAKATVTDYDLGGGGRIAVLTSVPESPPEVFAAGERSLRQLSHQNDRLMASIEIGTTEEIRFRSKDGTEIHGFVIKPPDYEKAKKYPTLLRIHGGPTSQFEHEFSAEWQLFAARGYVVVAANPRGSTGRGEQFSSAIYADWGNRDVQDVLAAVDHVIAAGIADPDRLGIGGWSYGGMLTNYTIATDRRFKAATSGASIANVLAGYGTDMYVREYEQELGRPWESLEAWLRISFPFLHADRIRTPTLFLGGSKDFNVPLLNSEQMYQALRSLGVPTRLVIYPDQFHGLTRPSFIKDRWQRYLDWYETYIPK